MERWKGKAGKVWVELYRGNCLDLLKQVPDGSVDLVMCDPPYGVTALSWDTRVPTVPLWEQYRRVLRPGGAAVLFAQQPYATELINGNRHWFRYEWIWDKKCVTGFGSAKLRPLRQHENILVFYGSTPVYHPQGLTQLPLRRVRRSAGTEVYRRGFGGGSVQEFTGYPRSILSFPRGQVERPCQEPVPLLEYLVRTYTEPGALVLDNTMGSGTTIVAAVRAGRCAIGMEKDRRAFEMARQKVEKELCEVRSGG